MGTRLPRGMATSIRAGITSVNPWRARAVTKQRVPCGAVVPKCDPVLSPTLASSQRRCAFRVRPSMPTDRVHGRVGCGQTHDGTWPAREERRDRFLKTVSCTSAQSDRRTASTARLSALRAGTGPSIRHLS
jgi:hypothetical protein